MNRLKGIVLGVAFMALPAIASAQTTIKFDTGLGDLAQIPNGYAGFNWSNFWALNGLTYYGNPSGYQTGVVSPSFIAYNGYAEQASVSSMSTNPFTFNSVYATAAWNTENVTFNGWLGGNLLYTDTFGILTSGPVFHTFNWGLVDRVDMVSDGGSQVAIDNLTVNGATVTPEPATLLLLATGLTGIGALMRRRQKNS